MKQIEIWIQGQISPRWSGWFEGLTISHPAHDETVLTGVVQDESAVYGIISRLRDLGLQITLLRNTSVQEDCHDRE